MIINLLPRMVRIQVIKDGSISHQVLLPSKLPFTMNCEQIQTVLTLSDGTTLRGTQERCVSSLPPVEPGVFYLATMEVQNSLKRPDIITIGRQLKSLVTSFINNY